MVLRILLRNCLPMLGAPSMKCPGVSVDDILSAGSIHHVMWSFSARRKCQGQIATEGILHLSGTWIWGRIPRANFLTPKFRGQILGSNVLLLFSGFSEPRFWGTYVLHPGFPWFPPFPCFPWVPQIQQSTPLLVAVWIVFVIFVVPVVFVKKRIAKHRFGKT